MGFFDAGISGLDAAANAVSTIGKNISNSNTVGYKSVQASFSNNVNTGASLETGAGVNTNAPKQVFTQGTITATSNPLDLAIKGNGFFAATDPITSQTTFTRDGQFSLNSSGNIVTSAGAQVLGYNALNGSIGSGSPAPIVVTSSNIPASVTNTISANVNLNDASAILAPQSIANGALYPSGYFLPPAIATQSTVAAPATNLASTIQSYQNATDPNITVSVIPGGSIPTGFYITPGTVAVSNGTTINGTGSPVNVVAAFKPTDGTTFSFASPVTVYNQIGDPQNMQLYFQRQADSLNGGQTFKVFATSLPASSNSTLTPIELGIMTFNTETSTTSGTTAGSLASLSAPPYSIVTATSGTGTTSQALSVNSSPSTGVFQFTNVPIDTIGSILNTAATGTALSSTLAVSSTTNIALGQYVSGAGIPAGTTVTAISGNNITLSNVLTVAGSGNYAFNSVPPDANTTATAGVSGATLLTVSSVTNIAVGQYVSGAGIPAGTTVTAISGLDITLSNALTATFSGTPANYAFATGSQYSDLVTLDLSKVVVSSAQSYTNSVTQNGYSAGVLTGFSVGNDGKITGNYTNSKTQLLGAVALANFKGVGGLASTGNNSWIQTEASGQPTFGVPGSGGLGALQASAVESSNVDQTAEMVNLLAAQRAYQANAATIKAEDTIAQASVNMG